jgi:hypothetical protein
MEKITDRDIPFYRPSPKFIGAGQRLALSPVTSVTPEEARRARVVVYRAYRQELISRQTLRLVLHGIRGCL